MMVKTSAAFAAIPPPVLVLLSIFSIQLGAAFATDLFPVLGPSGAVLSRLLISVLILVALFRPGPDPRILRHYKLLLAYGVTLALMNWCFYEAIARIPLGLAVTIEFMGPLTVAVITSRRRIDLLWVGVSVTGLLVLAPEIGGNLDSVGVLFAVIAGIGWGGFVLLSKRVSFVFPGNSGLVYGMAVACFFMATFASGNIIPVFFDIGLFGSVIGLALLSTTIPFFFEFNALKTLPPYTYGILIALEPAVAVVVGGVLLGDVLGIKELFAVACVTGAALGATVSGKK